MKRLLGISLLVLTFGAGFVVGKNQVPRMRSETELQKGTLEKKTSSGLEVTTQGLAQPITKMHQSELDNKRSALPEETARTVAGITYEVSDEEDVPEASPVEVYMLDDLRYSMKDAGVPEEEIKEAVEMLASSGVVDSGPPPSEKEIENAEIQALMDTGLSLEDIENMKKALPPLPPDENGDL